MYRILIVDDEYQIVEWLYSLLNGLVYLDLDIYKAYTGNEALELVNRIKMDIVISDICMPGMDGLELGEQINNKWPDCHIIFLTGYNEFDYIYTAIKYKNVEYLLKTEDDEKLLHMVEVAISEIDKSQKDTQMLEKARQQMHIAQPLIQREYIVNLLYNRVDKSKITQQQLEELEIMLDLNQPLLVIMGNIDFYPQNQTHLAEKSESLYSVKFVLEQNFCDFEKKLFIEYNRMSFLLLVQPDEAFINYGIDETLKIRLDTVQTICVKSSGISISFVIGNGFISWDELSKKVFYLEQLLAYSTSLGKERLLTEKYISEKMKEKFETQDNILDSSISALKRIDYLSDFLEQGCRNEFMELLEKIVLDLRNIKSKNFTPALEVYYSLSTFLLSYINRWKLVDKLAFKIGLNKLTRMDEHASWNDAVQYIFELVDTIFEIQKHEEEKTKADSIMFVKKYVDEHLREELSLSRLAEMVYFNPSYFSRQFKQVTGRNLTEYIQDSRVFHAKKLLQETDMKVQDIAVMVGVESSTYFSYFFKKTTGMSPNEYRSWLIKSKIN